MTNPSAWDRVEADIAAGRLWKARDRLHGMLVAAPADQKILDRLGELYYGMGDLPQAGRYWFLTTREDPRAQEARAALFDRFGRHPSSFGRTIPVQAPSEDFPSAVRDRLVELRPYLRPRVVKMETRQSTSSRWDEIFMTGCSFVAVALLVLGWVVGFVTILETFGNTTAGTIVGGVFVVIVLATVVVGANQLSRQRRASKAARKVTVVEEER